MGPQENAPVRCPCSRLVAHHAANRTMVVVVMYRDCCFSDFIRFIFRCMVVVAVVVAGVEQATAATA